MGLLFVGGGFRFMWVGFIGVGVFLATWVLLGNGVGLHGGGSGFRFTWVGVSLLIYPNIQK